MYCFQSPHQQFIPHLFQLCFQVSLLFAPIDIHILKQPKQVLLIVYNTHSWGKGFSQVMNSKLQVPMSLRSRSDQIKSALQVESSSCHWTGQMIIFWEWGFERVPNPFHPHDDARMLVFKATTEIPGKMVGLGSALESSIESKFFTLLFQSSYRCMAKVWAFHCTLREKNSRHEESKKAFSQPMVWTTSLAHSSLRREDWFLFIQFPPLFRSYGHTLWSTLTTSPIPQPQEHKAFQFFATK